MSNAAGHSEKVRNEHELWTQQCGCNSGEVVRQGPNSGCFKRREGKNLKMYSIAISFEESYYCMVKYLYSTFLY